MFHTALAVHQIVVPELCPTGGSEGAQSDNDSEMQEKPW